MQILMPILMQITTSITASGSSAVGVTLTVAVLNGGALLYLQSDRDLSIAGMYIQIRQHLHVRCLIVIESQSLPPAIRVPLVQRAVYIALMTELIIDPYES